MDGNYELGMHLIAVKVKQYELSNHLGNVLAVVSDRKIAVDDDGTGTADGTIDYYTADILSSQDYYAFGSLMPGRNYSSGEYRFSFNGQEKTDEISGNGNHNTAMFWEYDTRTGRRWNLDPKPTFGVSEYSTFAGNPILFSDPLGDTLSVSKSASLQFTVAVAKSILFLAKKDAADIFIALQKHPNTITIADARQEGKNPGPNQGSYFNPKTNTIYWNPDQGVLTTEFQSISPVEIFNHEGDHALQRNTNPEQMKKDLKPDSNNPYNNKEEQRVITGSEQKVAKKVGSIKEGEVTRKDHDGTFFLAKDVTSNEDKKTITITPDGN